jgi:hypothetical protein
MNVPLFRSPKITRWKRFTKLHTGWCTGHLSQKGTDFDGRTREAQEDLEECSRIIKKSAERSITYLDVLL